MEVIQVLTWIGPGEILGDGVSRDELWSAVWRVAAVTVFMRMGSGVPGEPNWHKSCALFPPRLSLVGVNPHTPGLPERVRWVHSAWRPSPTTGSPTGTHLITQPEMTGEGLGGVGEGQ